MSIQALKESLPELTDAKFDQVYRQFLLKALGPVLGYDRAKSEENWDQVMDVFAKERERRYGPGLGSSVVATKEAQEEEEPEDQEMIEDPRPEDIGRCAETNRSDRFDDRSGAR